MDICDVRYHGNIRRNIALGDSSETCTFFLLKELSFPEFKLSWQIRLILLQNFVNYANMPNLPNSMKIKNLLNVSKFKF